MADKEVSIKISAQERVTRSFARIGAKAREAANKIKRIATSKAAIRATAKAALSLGRALASAVVRGAQRAGRALKRLAGQLLSVRNISRVVGGALKAALVGGLTLLAGAAMGIPALFGAMKDAMEGTGEGAAAGMGAAGESAKAASDDISDAVDKTEAAANKVEVIFGAFGRVGAGFVQAQGKVLDQAASTADAAVAKAQAAAAGMDAAKDSIGDATRSMTGFGKATDRISSVWTKAKTKVLQAIAKAIAPALKKLAKFMESPAFQKFVDLLAKDLAAAAAKVAKWIVDKVIPAIKDLMQRINDAGGPIEFFKAKWEELKERARMVLAIIVGLVLIASNKMKARFESFKKSALAVWERIKSSASETWEAIKAGVKSVATAIGEAFAAVGETLKGILNGIIGGFENALNSLRNAANKLIKHYNKIATILQMKTIDLFPKIVLPRLQAGGIALNPTLAVVGDSPSPEIIAPLDDLVPLLRDALGGIGAPGTLIINVDVPPGTANPQTFGETVGNSIIMKMRRAGLRLPAT